MIQLQFPKINNALNKKLDDRGPGDPQRGVNVFNGVAIVVRDNFIVCIDLMEYFVMELNIEDEEEIKECKKILDYMNYKMFPNDMWAELIKAVNIEIDSGMITVSNPKYSKDLHYKDVDVEYHDFLRKLSLSFNRHSSPLEDVSLPLEAILTISRVLDLKSEKMIFMFTGMDDPATFTFSKRKYVFGYITPDYHSANEHFKLSYYEAFINHSDVMEFITEGSKKQSVIPAPPPPSKVEEKDDESQVKMDIT